MRDEQVVRTPFVARTSFTQPRDAGQGPGLAGGDALVGGCGGGHRRLLR